MATDTQAQTITKPKRHLFDPDRLAYLETTGLRAYYDHKWFLMLRLVLQLMHEQFGLSWLRSVQATYGWPSRQAMVASDAQPAAGSSLSGPPSAAQSAPSQRAA